MRPESRSRPTLREKLRQYIKERPLPEQDFIDMKDEMVKQGQMLSDLQVADDPTISGAGDPGKIVKETDIKISGALLKLAKQKYPGSFSEEHDPKDKNHIFPPKEKFARLRKWAIRMGKWMIDPVDGTGDRDKGEPGTPEGMGFSILNTFVRNGIVEAGIVVRPAYNQVLTYKDGQIQLTEKNTSKEITTESREATRRDVSSDDPDVVRVNIRTEYPQTHFPKVPDVPEDFWDFATKITGYRFEQVRGGGAGDSLSKLVLGELDLVVARVGDWKSWDTGPFDPMIEKLGGTLTNCDGKQLGGYDREDLWHRRGVIASIGEKGVQAHAALLHAMREYKYRHNIDLIISPKKS